MGSLTCSAQSSRGSFTTSANGCESGTSRLVNNVTGRRICSQMLTRRVVSRVSGIPPVCVNFMKSIAEREDNKDGGYSRCGRDAAASVGCAARRMDLLGMGGREQRIRAVSSNWPAPGSRTCIPSGG